MQLSKQGVERYDPRPTTDPAIDADDWQASFDGGNFWATPQVVDDAPTWMVAGTDAYPYGGAPGDVIVLPDRLSVTPLMRFMNGEEVIVREGPPIYLF